MAPFFNRVWDWAQQCIGPSYIFSIKIANGLCSVVDGSPNIKTTDQEKYVKQATQTQGVESYLKEKNVSLVNEVLW